MTLVVLAGLPIISYAKSAQNNDEDQNENEEGDGVWYNVHFFYHTVLLLQVLCD